MDIQILVTNCDEATITSLKHYQSIYHLEIKSIADIAPMLTGCGRASMFSGNIDPETGLVDEESVQM